MIHKKLFGIMGIWSLALVALAFQVLYYNDIYFTEVVVDWIATVFMTIVYIWTCKKIRVFDIFHPIHLVTVLYLCLFGVAPILLTVNDKVDLFGVNVMGGSIQATIIACIGYVAFCIGYINGKLKNYEKQAVVSLDAYVKRGNILIVSYGMWIVFYVLFLIYLLGTGYTLSYILSLGQVGSLRYSFVNAKFLINCGYATIIPALYIWVFDSTKFARYIIAYLTSAALFTMGFRFIVVVFLVGLLIASSRHQNKEIKLRTIGFFVIALLLLLTIMGTFRQAIRTGAGASVDIADITGREILYTLESNFNIYMPYYRLVEKMPSEIPHTFGRGMLVDTLAMWIPRALWPGKPHSYVVGDIIKKVCSDFAIDNAAMAWPNIGEFYMDFGIIGVVVCLYIFGIICKKSVSLYNSKSEQSVILYATFYPAILQLVIRGFMPNNCTMLVFLLLPALVYQKMFSSRR